MFRPFLSPNKTFLPLFILFARRINSSSFACMTLFFSSFLRLWKMHIHIEKCYIQIDNVPLYLRVFFISSCSSYLSHRLRMLEDGEEFSKYSLYDSWPATGQIAPLCFCLGVFFSIYYFFSLKKITFKSWFAWPLASIFFTVLLSDTS